MSLTELVVTVGILGIVLAYVTQGFLSVQTATTTETLRLENLEQARVLMDNVTKDLRTAVRLGTTSSPFLLADDTEVTFYGNLNLTSSCPKRIHLFVDSQTRLIEEVTEPDAGGSPPACSYTGATTQRFVGRYVANPSSQPVFTYYYDNGSADIAFAASATPLSASDMQLVTGVGVQLSIRKPTNYTLPHSTLVNKVRLPNVDYNPLPSPSP